MTNTRGRTVRSRHHVWISLLMFFNMIVQSSASCERLKATLTYTQEEAPRDLSGLLPVVVEKVNRVLDGVVDVEVEWTGADLHGRVGEHIVECTVTRLASAVASEDLEIFQDEDGREVTSQCFHVPFTILDTNECTLPAKHPMRHVCPYPSVCVNTIGSYECLCPRIGGGDLAKNEIITADEDPTFWQQIAAENRSPWEVSFALESKSSCSASPSTHGCCPTAAFSTEGRACRKRFRCPEDPCTSKSDCASNAQCVRSDLPTDFPNYSCVCPEGLMGNGHVCQPKDVKPQPKVMYDGVTPTETTIKNNFYCGCTIPIVDACSGYPPCKGKHEVCTVGADNAPSCACKPGYVFHEKYGCVDVHPPTLKLRHDPQGDQTLRLKQGDEYREFMVDIIDDNAEDYLRSLKISYSKPLPPGCLTQVGEFHVNYTVAMPWATTPYVRITRRVIIDDINECMVDQSKYQHTCPSLVPQCDRAAGAKCINSIGSYACQCPSETTGDGFLKSAKFASDIPPPNSYQGGTSCVDSSKPIITLAGPNPKVFKTCECGGLSGIMSQSNSESTGKDLQAEQRGLFDQDIKEMIRSTAGAELCATHDNPHPKPSECAVAVDHTFQGPIDLSDRVVIGEPVQKSPLKWVVPYDVTDDAGNVAVTVWRDIIVEEVDLATVESKIRQEVMEEQQRQKERDIQIAIREERRKWEKERDAQVVTPTRNNRRSAIGSCPACPPCDCPETLPQANRESCQAYCYNISQSCTLSDESYVYKTLFWLEQYLPSAIVPTLVTLLLASIILLIFQCGAKAALNATNSQKFDQSKYRGNDASLLLSPVPPHHPSNPAPSHALQVSTVPAASTGMGNNDITNGFFSPNSTNGLQSPPGLPPSSNRSVRFDPALPPQTPESTNRYQRGLMEHDLYRTPSVITPSRNGEGARRRSPYQ